MAATHGVRHTQADWEGDHRVHTSSAVRWRQYWLGSASPGRAAASVVAPRGSAHRRARGDVDRLLVLLLSSGPWSRAISKALFESGGYSRWALAAADAVVYSLLTLPLAVAIVLVGRSVGRVAAALALVLLGVALGATPAASVISSHNARIAIAVLMSMALAAAWICARRRNPLGLLAVLVAGLLALVISVAGDSLLSGDDVLA